VPICLSLCLSPPWLGSGVRSKWGPVHPTDRVNHIPPEMASFRGCPTLIFGWALNVMEILHVRLLDICSKALIISCILLFLDIYLTLSMGIAVDSSTIAHTGVSEAI